MGNEKQKKSMTAFSILLIMLIVLWGIAYLVAGSTFAPITPKGAEEAVSAVIKPGLDTLVMAPFKGFQEAIEICVFILVLGGFLGIVMKTGALEAGIQSLVKKLKGNELILIPILMFLFSLGGTVYGMAEETVAFYALITATLVAARFDTLVAVGTVLFGSGAGVLGSTVNPFATGVAAEALRGIGYQPNQSVIIGIGTVLWLAVTAFAIWYVMRYAKQVKADKGSTILSLQEQENMMKYYGKESDEELAFGGREKGILAMFGFTFLIMIVSLIPWPDFGITIWESSTAWLTGTPFGEWYFGDLAMWFFIMSLVIGVVAKMGEHDIVDTFIAGAADILSVVLIIVVARGASVIMGDTHLDLFILDRASNILTGLSPIVFVPVAYAIYLLLSFLIPSTSALAFVSIPILGGLTAKLGMDPNIMIMIFCAGAGLINLITPTSGVVMGGLQIAKVEYTTWLKFMKVPVIAIVIMSLVILTVAMVTVGTPYPH